MGHDLKMRRFGKTRAWWVPPALRGYRSEWLRHDLVAGAALFAILVPAGMAYAQASGLPPVTGLYATFGWAVRCRPAVAKQGKVTAGGQRGAA